MAAGPLYGGYLPSKFRNFPPKICSQKTLIRRPPPPPIFLSTNPTHINPLRLRDLYTLCNHSCHRFPNLDSDGRVEPIDVDKLRIALSHSSVVVSVFSKPEFISHSSSEISNLTGNGGDWFRRLMPVTPFNGRLVGFGRAVSDFGLTASIYDVMVIPTLRGRGIGRMIVQRILRMLMNRGVYDIAAVCSDKEWLFFEACGFGDDILGSTTMMYTRTDSSSPKGNLIIKCSGRKLLLVPPLRAPFQS